MIAVEGLALQQSTFALEGITFEVPAGACAVLMGRTGSGKTTVLEAIAGLRKVNAGRVLLNGRDVTRLPPAARGVGYVPQDAALFKTMTVYENIAFALAVRKAPGREIELRVRALAEQLGLAPLLPRRAVGLSGGEAQRVALARALAFRPRVLLLDEPLSAVDADTRSQIVALLRTLKGETTVLLVTHNRADAGELGDGILLFENGKISAERPA